MKKHSWTRWMAAAAATAMAGTFAAPALAAPSSQTQSLAAANVAARLAGVSSDTPIFIQTKGVSGLEVSAANGTSTQARSSMRAAATAAADSAKATADGVFDQLKQLDPNAKLVYTTSYTIPGIAVYASTDAITKLAEHNANVVKVSPITLKTATTASTADVTGANATPANANNDALTRALSAWTQTGKTGEGVNIAIMDTGLDYTHADFGGPGTEAAYQQALASKSVPDGLYDAAKFLGGTDLAGESYYPNDNVHVYPDPDSNPIDGQGGHHGTHVAGTAAGYGVKADGTSAKDSDYTKLSESDVKGMTIAPGSAPKAGIYSVKVFGDNGGSTGLVGAGLDWVAENLVKGNKIDILSMSLGGGYGSPDDPDTAKVNELTKQGVLSVVAAGNDGDYTDIMGSPATAASSLAVAASQSGGTLQDAITATAPSDLAGTRLAGQYSQNYAKLDDFSVEGKVVKVSDPANLNGCAAYSAADAAAVKGNIAWVDWDDANVACGSGTRFNNATQAGAVGIIFASQSKLPSAGIAGNADIPGFQVTAPGVEKIKSALDAGTLSVKLSSDQRMSEKVDYSDDYQDVVADFTSRGLHGSADGTVKPDVSAPGVGIVSASAGTGTKPEVMSGTSMATPLTSGVAALTFEAHPDWTPLQVKAAVMNTADHDVTITKGGAAMSPIRSGTGRIDALDAVNNPVTVADKDDPTAVTGQFGIVQVPADGYTATKTFVVANDSDKAVTYNVAYQPRTETPGVTYTVDKSTLTVPAKGSATFAVTLSIPDQSALRHTRDTTQPVKNPSLASRDSDYVTDASGVVRLAPADGSDAAFSPLRVAVSSAPKPASATKAALTLSKEGAKDGTLAITGKGFKQGDGAEAYVSQVAPMQLLTEDPAGDEATSADTARSAAAGDIRTFGFSSTARQLADPSQGYLTFGLQTDKTWSSLGYNFIPEIDFDVTGDQKADYATIVQTAETISGKSTATSTAWVQTLDAATGKVVDEQELPAASLFDANTMILPIKLSAIGVTKSTKTFNVLAQATIISSAAANATGSSQISDSTKAVKFDALNPDIRFGEENGAAGSGTYLWDDADGTSVPMRLGAGPDAKDAKALILHTGSVAPVKSDDAIANIDIQTPSVPAPTPQVDKTKLQTLVDSTKDYKASDYTPDSWAAFQTALANAQSVLGNADATQEQVDAAYNELQTAITGLKAATPQVNKTKLQGLVDAAKDYKESDYTPDSWAAFQTALANAQSVLDNANATQADVDAAYDALNTAIKDLQAQNKPGETANKDDLQRLVDSTKDYKESDYTPDSWAAFQTALANAQSVLGNANATQTDVDAAYNELQTAIKGLKTPTPQVDKTKLQGLVNAYKALTNDGYTDDSWNAFQAALANAQSVLDNADASQANVDAAYDQLAAAYGALAKAPSGNDDNATPAPEGQTAAPNADKNAQQPAAKGDLAHTGAAVGIVLAALVAAAAGAALTAARRRASKSSK